MSLTVGLCALAAPSAIAAVTPTARPASTCAWPQRVGVDDANIFFPDTAAIYWVMPYSVNADLRVTLEGEYPDARYASFNVYHGDNGSFTSNGVASALADYQIDPDPGGGNPWQQPVDPGGRFTLTVQMDVSPDQRNVLPLAPQDAVAGSEGYLVYRVYLPAGGDFSAVHLPTVTLHQDGTSQVLPECPAAGQASAAKNSVAARRAATLPAEPAQIGAAGAQSIAFARSTGEQSVFPNADAAYLEAWVLPPALGDVVVIRAKAPHAVAGAHPTSWPDQRYDLRYWSACVNLTYPLRPVVVNRLSDGQVDYGCRHDDVTALDADGYYTYVVGTEAQRSEIESIPGVTFLPFSLSQPDVRHLILLRNMLPSDGFEYAAQRVPQDGDPESAKAVMGAYYPRAAVCQLDILATSGPAGCPLPS